MRSILHLLMTMAVTWSTSQGQFMPQGGETYRFAVSRDRKSGSVSFSVGRRQHRDCRRTVRQLGGRGGLDICPLRWRMDPAGGKARWIRERQRDERNASGDIRCALLGREHCHCRGHRRQFGGGSSLDLHADRRSLEPAGGEACRHGSNRRAHRRTTGGIGFPRG